jgi:Mg-chelatase subunit ChlD
MLNVKDFKKNTDGNVAMMFAVSTVMLLMGIGAAVDYSGMSRAKGELQSQVDAAVLAAAMVEIEKTNKGRGKGADKKEEKIRKDVAYHVIEANGFDLSASQPDFRLGSDRVTLKAEVEYQPTFGGILGVNSMKLSAVSVSGLPGNESVDIALVMDNTGSMGAEGKMDALKEGAVALIEAVEDSGSETKIGLVPFSRYVRVDESLSGKSWLDVPAPYDTDRLVQQATHTGGTCNLISGVRLTDGVEIPVEFEECLNQTTTYEDVPSKVESFWEGCVGTRDEPLSEQDGSYVTRIPALLNVIPHEVSGLNRDTQAWCPAKIMPLTTDYEALKQHVRSLWSTDSTYIPSGLIWGKRVLSPGEPFDNAEAGDKRQVMVLMTDGENTTEIKDGSAEFDKAPPYISNADLGDGATKANQATSRLCESLKSSGVEIYTIAFKVNDPATKKLLRNCASEPSKAFTSDSNQGLVSDFKEISNSLKADVRLMR